MSPFVCVCFFSRFFFCLTLSSIMEVFSFLSFNLQCWFIRIWMRLLCKLYNLTNQPKDDASFIQTPSAKITFTSIDFVNFIWIVQFVKIIIYAQTKSYWLHIDLVCRKCFFEGRYLLLMLRFHSKFQCIKRSFLIIYTQSKLCVIF